MCKSFLVESAMQQWTRCVKSQPAVHQRIGRNARNAVDFNMALECWSSEHLPAPVFPVRAPTKQRELPLAKEVVVECLTTGGTAELGPVLHATQPRPPIVTSCLPCVTLSEQPAIHFNGTPAILWHHASNRMRLHSVWK